MRLPSGLNATLLTQPVCPLRVRISWPVAASHTFTVLSQLPVAMRLPSGLNATLLTRPVCPLRVRISWPVRGVPDLHRLVLAAGDDAFAVGAERHAADRAGVSLEGEDLLARAPRPRPSPSCPQLPVARRLPSGLNATLVTPSVCPLRVRSFLAGAPRPRPSPSCPRCRRRCVCRRG